ncbi:hypothetical protein Tco_1302889 [Tanacetum coccineum]
MDTTRAHQQALDEELVALADRLKIWKSNLRLSSTLKSKEPTLQVDLDALKLTPFYNAFEISTNVPEIYMQEFWVTVIRHHSSLRFKLDGKSPTVNVDNFRDMLKVCPKLPGQKFEEPPLEEDILSFIKDLRHTGEIKFLFDVNVNHMHQPWKSFAAIINKCLSGKTTSLEIFASYVLKFFGACIITSRFTMSIYCGKTWYFKWRTRILKRTMTCIIHVSPKLLSTTSWQRIKQFQGETRCFGITPGMTSCSPP